MFSPWGIPFLFPNYAPESTGSPLPRGMTSAYSAALNQSSLKVFHLYEGQFPSGTIRLTDLPYDITFSGESYLGTGGAVGFEPIEEVAGLQANGVKVHFNAVDASLLAILQGQNLIDRPAFIWRGLLDANNQSIVDPVVIFEGRTDSMNLSEDPDNGSMLMTLDCLDENSDFNRTNGRHTNNEEQQALFPGDKGFEFIADGMDKVLTWG